MLTNLPYEVVRCPIPALHIKRHKGCCGTYNKKRKINEKMKKENGGKRVKDTPKRIVLKAMFTNYRRAHQNHDIVYQIKMMNYLKKLHKISGKKHKRREKEKHYHQTGGDSYHE